MLSSWYLRKRFKGKRRTQARAQILFRELLKNRRASTRIFSLLVTRSAKVSCTLSQRAESRSSAPLWPWARLNGVGRSLLLRRTDHYSTRLSSCCRPTTYLSTKTTSKLPNSSRRPIDRTFILGVLTTGVHHREGTRRNKDYNAYITSSADLLAGQAYAGR